MDCYLSPPKSYRIQMGSNPDVSARKIPNNSRFLQLTAIGIPAVYFVHNSAGRERFVKIKYKCRQPRGSVPVRGVVIELSIIFNRLLGPDCWGRWFVHFYRLHRSAGRAIYGRSGDLPFASA